MAISLVSLLQYLHLAAVIVWVGGSLFMALAVWPMLLARPPREAKPIFDAIAKSAGPVMAISGNAVIVAGVMRATWLGPVRSFAVLTTPYGVAFSCALALTIALAVHGGGSEKRAHAWLSGDGAAISAEVVRQVRLDGYLTFAGFAAILMCMMVMHFGI